MDKVSSKNTFNLQRSVVSVGISPGIPDDSNSTYICRRKEDIYNIPQAGHYDIIVNYSDQSVNDVIYDLFNYLIPMDVPLRVMLVFDKVSHSNYVPKYVTFLEKLEKHKFIQLEYVNDSQIESVSQEENIVFFVGPGNTGKTSIIASVSELFKANSQRLALIDITRKNKLINYFPKHGFLNTNNLKDFNLSRDFYRSVNAYTDGIVDLYVYDYDCDPKGPEIIYFCEILRKLSDLYDYIIVNADENSVLNTPYVFKTANKVFIVHDFMPTKIKTTKRLLLKLISAGIDTQKNVSLIYNKTVKNTVSLGSIEEKLLFIRLPNKRIMPTVDLNCKTFEIPYDQKTMTAIIKNLASNTTGIENTSKMYQLNISNIYKFINDIPYTESDELEISQYVKEKLKRVVKGKLISESISSLAANVRNIKRSSICEKSSSLVRVGIGKVKSAKLSGLISKHIRAKS